MNEQSGKTYNTNGMVWIDLDGMGSVTIPAATGASGFAITANQIRMMRGVKEYSTMSLPSNENAVRTDKCSWWKMIKSWFAELVSWLV